MTSPHPTRRRALHGLLAAGLAPSFAVAQPARPDVRQLVDRVFRPLMAAHDIPGMTVGVTQAGMRHQFHYGVASRESGAPVTADTLFEIGSLSKAFTATLAAYAQALGKLSLRDTPGRHVPALRGSAIDRATLLHLATYTAGGLPLQFPDDVTTLAAAMQFYRAFAPAAAPGAQRRYSNPSIGLLGHATAQAMRGEFVEICESVLFPRLGLRSTFLRVPAPEMDRYAWGHRNNQPVRVNPGMFDAEAYGVKSTAADLLRFLEANMRPAGLEAPLRTALEATHAGHFAVGEMVQGLGWEQYPWPLPLDRLQAGNAGTMALDPHPARALEPDMPAGARLFNKTGSTNGFGVYAAFVPQADVGIVMLANRNIPNAARIAAAYEVLAALG